MGFVEGMWLESPFIQISVLTLMTNSDLHLYRGVEDCGTDFSMGHEFTGTVIDIGNSVSNFQIGDEIVSPFTITW